MSDSTTETTFDVPPLTDEVHDTADRIVRRYPVARSALLPLLHLVQSVQNHITDDGIAFCAEKVGLTRAEVGAVATFYTMYKREPVGDWLLSVCTNPTCKQKGGQEIYENYVAALGGKHRDPETKVTVEHAECLGICDGAPVVQVNYEMFGPMTVAEGDQLLAACRKGDPPVSPWSGEKPPTFAELERDLSGANDAWEAELHKAALQQIAYEHPPTYRTGETDIPVTHPGGDPAGVGGTLFREAAAGRDAAPEAATPTGTDVPTPAGGDAIEVEGDVPDDASTSGSTAHDVHHQDGPAPAEPAEADEPVEAAEPGGSDAENQPDAEPGDAAEAAATDGDTPDDDAASPGDDDAASPGDDDDEEA